MMVRFIWVFTFECGFGFKVIFVNSLARFQSFGRYYQIILICNPAILNLTFKFVGLKVRKGKGKS